MPGVPYYIAHEPAGTGGANDLFKANNPGGAGRVQMLLGNNAAWLSQVNPCRVLANHPGFNGFNDPGVNSYPFTFLPGSDDINWNQPYGAKGSDVGANACLGLHYAWPYYGTNYYPRLVISSRYRIRTANTKIALFVQVLPGVQNFGVRVAQSVNAVFDSAVVGTGFNAWDWSANPIPTLTAIDTGVGANSSATYALPPSGGAPSGEAGTLSSFSIYVGAAIQAGAADWVGLTAYLIPPVSV